MNDNSEDNMNQQLMSQSVSEQNGILNQSNGKLIRSLNKLGRTKDGTVVEKMAGNMKKIIKTR